MRRRTRLAVVLALVVSAVGAGLAVASPQPQRPGTCVGTGRLQTCVAVLPGGVTVKDAHYTVLLPAGYDTNRRRYPVVYVLHGVGDDYASWTNPSRGDLTALTAACQAIFVMPDGGSGPLAGWYSDWKDGRYEYETFHTKVLPQQVDTRFRTQPRARAVAGLSMGGFGALSYTARHPGMYKATASYSGFADSQFGAPVSGAFYDVGGQNPVYSLGTPNKGVWGDQLADQAIWAAHNPFALVSRFKGQPLYLSTGHGLPGGSQGDDPSKAANYPTEAYVGQLNDRFASALTAQGIRFTDARESGGRHDWPYWRANFTTSLKVPMPPLHAATKGCGA